MHYKDGTEAKIGDIARGKGYNHSYEVQGIVIGLTPGSESCNLRIAIAKGAPYLLNPAHITETNHGSFDGMRFTAGLARYSEDRLLAYGAEVEYGTVADFELVHRPIEGPHGQLR